MTETNKSKPIWAPDLQRIARSNLTEFINYTNKKYKQHITDYTNLYRWSIDQPTHFWESIWEFTGIIHSSPYSSVIEGNDIRTAKWFEGSKLNFAENLLRHRSDKVA